MLVSGYGFMALDLRYEFIKKVPRVVRTGRGFGVILYAKHWQVGQADARHRLIVQVTVGDLNVLGGIQAGFADHETVVLRGDFTLAGQQVLHRVVDAAVAVKHLLGAQALAQRNDLVAKA